MKHSVHLLHKYGRVRLVTPLGLDVALPIPAQIPMSWLPVTVRTLFLQVVLQQLRGRAGSWLCTTPSLG